MSEISVGRSNSRSLLQGINCRQKKHQFQYIMSPPGDTRIHYNNEMGISQLIDRLNVIIHEILCATLAPILTVIITYDNCRPP